MTKIRIRTKMAEEKGGDDDGSRKDGRGEKKVEGMKEKQRRGRKKGKRS